MSVQLGEEEITSTTTRREATTTRERAGGGMLVAALSDVRLLLIALWLGAAVFFSAAVAPSAFAVLRSFAVPNANEVAGAIVTRTLSIVNVSGFIIASVLLVSTFLLRDRLRRRAFYLEILSLALVMMTTGVGQWVIAAQMRALRVQMGRPIDQVAQDDALRVAFNDLHGYSVSALAVGIIAAVIALLVIARRAKRTSAGSVESIT